MNEIEKLYENAGIEKEVIKGCYDYYSKLGIDIWKENDCSGKNCDTCKKDKSIKRYPLFTAEKQIEILKLILKKRRILDVGYIIEQEKYHCMHYERVFNSFEEALCADINYHWQDLTEEERQQIKEILE